MSELEIDPSLLRALRAGELVLLNTETLPGLHASAGDPDSLERLTRLKGAPPGRPFLLLFESWESVCRYGLPRDPRDGEALAEVWPGPLTALLVPTARAPAHWIHEGRTLAARVPGAPALRSLISLLGSPLFSTSANRSGEDPPRDLDSARAQFPELVFSDLGLRPTGRASTLVDLSVQPACVLRQGSVAWPPQNPSQRPS